MSHKNNSYRFKQLRLAVLERDGHCCYMCGNYANEADHVIPKSKLLALGVPIEQIDSMENLRAACRKCNNSKSNKMPGSQTTWVNPKYRRQHNAGKSAGDGR